MSTMHGAATSTYRLVYYSSDPFSGAHSVLGAIVTSCGKSVGVPASGGDSRVERRLIARIAVIDTPGLPSVFGPYTQLSEPRPIPDGVADAADWVRMLLP